MKIIFSTQGLGLDIYFNVLKEMNISTKVEASGFYVADSRYFNQFKKTNNNIEEYPLLKEWEIIEESFKMELDTDLLREYEEKLGNPFLWNALLSDRRIYFGSKYALTQDYKPRYSHEQMLRILQCALIEMENLW